MSEYSSELGDIVIFRENTNTYHAAQITHVTPTSYGIIYWKNGRPHYVRAIYGDKPGTIRRKSSSSDSNIIRDTGEHSQPDGKSFNDGVVSREGASIRNPVTTRP